MSGISVLAIAAQSMSDDMSRLATISNNLANATTPGFKKDIPIARTFVEVLQAAGGNDQLSFVTTMPVTDTVVDSRAGSLHFTGGPLDVAIDGNGFFELQSEQGPLYTRQGNLQIDSHGRIVHSSGIPLAGDLTLTTTQPRIDAQGNVFEDDKLVGQLRIAAFDPRTPMLKQGEGVFAAPDAAASRISSSKVRQGYLENSNVVTVTEMVSVIETMRHFEATQKLIQGYDGMLDKAIRTLGEF